MKTAMQAMAVAVLGRGAVAALSLTSILATALAGSVSVFAREGSPLNWMSMDIVDTKAFSGREAHVNVRLDSPSFYFQSMYCRRFYRPKGTAKWQWLGTGFATSPVERFTVTFPAHGTEYEIRVGCDVKNSVGLGHYASALGSFTTYHRGDRTPVLVDLRRSIYVRGDGWVEVSVGYNSRRKPDAPKCLRRCELEFVVPNGAPRNGIRLVSRPGHSYTRPWNPGETNAGGLVRQTVLGHEYRMYVSRDGKRMSNYVTMPQPRTPCDHTAIVPSMPRSLSGDEDAADHWIRISNPRRVYITFSIDGRDEAGTMTFPYYRGLRPYRSVRVNMRDVERQFGVGWPEGWWTLTVAGSGPLYVTATMWQGGLRWFVPVERPATCTIDTPKFP